MTQVAATAQRKLALDMMDQMEAFWNSKKYRALNNTFGSLWYTEQSKSGEKFSDELMQHLHDQIWTYKGLRTNTAEVDDFDEWSEWFENEMWPDMVKKIDEHPGLGYFYLFMAKNSDTVPMFDKDAWDGNLAIPCLLSCGVTHDIHGKMKPIRMDDPMLIYIKENSSLCFMRFRSGNARAVIEQLKLANPGRRIRVGVFGGGAESALWIGGPVEGVEVIVYDINPKAKDALEQIMEQPLEELGIDYRVDNFTSAFSDSSLHGTFDLVIYNGVMSYYPEKKVAIAAGTKQLLRKGGIMLYDDILMHPDMEFGLLVRCWTVELKPEKSLEIAIEHNKDALAKAGLRLDHYECQQVRGIDNVVVTWAVND